MVAKHTPTQAVEKEARDKERFLSRAFAKKPFESRMAASKLSAAEVLKLLSAESYVKRMSIDRPKTQEALLDRMVLDKLLVKEINGLYSITNLGAICFAEKLSNFPSLARRAFRIVRYADDSRHFTEKEFVWDQGYAVDFDGLIRLIKGFCQARRSLAKPFDERSACILKSSFVN